MGESIEVPFLTHSVCIEMLACMATVKGGPREKGINAVSGSHASRIGCDNSHSQKRLTIGAIGREKARTKKAKTTNDDVLDRKRERNKIVMSII
jgi:hypothetical protein